MGDVVISLGGLTPAEMGVSFLRGSQRPIAAPTVDTTLSLPGMHGALDYGAYLGPRPFSFDCAVATSNSRSTQEVAAAFVTHLLDDMGRPRTLPLVLANEPDRAYWVRYSGQLPIDRLVGLGRFTLPMTAFKPFAMSTFETTGINVDVDLLVESDFLVDSTYSFRVSSPGTITVQNLGTIRAQPVLIVSGSFTSFAVTIGGVQLTYGAAMSGTLEIDYGRKTVVHNGTNALRNTNRRFGSLPLGNADIIVGGTGLNISLDVQFRYTYS